MKRIKYILSLLLSVMGIVLLFAGILYFAISDRMTADIVLSIILSGIGISIIIFTRGARINARQSYNFDEYGNSRQNYASMSQAERKIIDMTVMAENETILSTAEYNSMVRKGSKNPDKDLQELIGLINVKDKIAELKAKMEYADKKDRHSYHLCFLGNPGTGKTTVAKIYTGFLYKYKYIKKNEYIYTDASSIMTGNSARKIKLILNKSHGKVVFIDEAYALMYDRSGEGGQILALLLNEMENSRNNIVIILAGYKEEMKALFQMNEGLHSRINTFMFFEDYDQNELADILKITARKAGYEVDKDAFDYMVNILLYRKCLPTFANGRTVRKLFEQTLDKHFLNLSKGIDDRMQKNTITYEDVVDDCAEENYLN